MDAVQAAQRRGALPQEALTLIEDASNEFLFSVVSLRGITIKQSLGREDFVVDPRLLRPGLQNNGYIELPGNAEHALAVGDLPPLRKNPFDRMLVAQLRVQGVPLLTSDTEVARYAGTVRLV